MPRSGPDSVPTRACSSLTGRDLGDETLVRFPELVVLPLDDRLAAHAREELPDFLALPLGMHTFGNDVAHAFERLQGGFLEGLELEDLVAAAGANRGRHFARLHRLHHLLQPLRQFRDVDRTDEAARSEEHTSELQSQSN